MIANLTSNLANNQVYTIKIINCQVLKKIKLRLEFRHERGVYVLLMYEVIMA